VRSPCTNVREVIHVGGVADEGDVLRAKLRVDARAADPQPLRHGDVGNRGGLVAGRVQGDRVDDSELVDRPVFEGEREVRALLAHRAVEGEAVALLADGGRRVREGIAGVHPLRGVGREQRAVKVLRSRLGEDLDVAALKGRLAVLRREEVRVDLDAGNGGLGR
jgi:hypothetical protein